MKMNRKIEPGYDVFTSENVPNCEIIWEHRGGAFSVYLLGKLIESFYSMCGDTHTARKVANYYFSEILSIPE